jgi:hypothetical protein
MLTVVLSVPLLRFMLGVFLSIAAEAVRSLFGLLRIDGAATSWLLALAICRFGVVLVPLLVALRGQPFCRLLWLVPLVLPVVLASASLSMPAREIGWGVLLAASLAALVLQRLPWMRWVALLPLCTFFWNFYAHELGPQWEWGAVSRERRLADCLGRDGERPVGLTAKLVRPYHGITSFDDDLVLLTGVGENDGGAAGSGEAAPLFSSWWLRRGEGERFAFEAESRATGNLWRGCRLGDTLWLGRANRLVGVTRLPPGSPTVERGHFPLLPADDMDFGEPACDIARNRVFVGEVTGGGLWEVDAALAENERGDVPMRRGVRRHEIGAHVLLSLRRFDGQIVVKSLSQLVVFDPLAGRVSERVPAALFSFGFDVCPLDGRAAMPDMMGRVRVFRLDSDGHYQFDWGLSLVAPRRVAFSRDCSRLAVASFDDHTVSFVDVATRRVVETHQAGPALREVQATGPREFSITDICGMTTYRW